MRDSSMSGSRSSVSSRGRSPRDSTFDRDSPTPRLPRPRRHDHREPRSGNLKKVRGGVASLWRRCKYSCTDSLFIYQYLHLYIHHLTWFCTFIYTLNNCKSINLIQMHVWWDVLRYISKLSLTQCILYHPTAIFQVDGRIRRGWFYSQFWHVFLISKILGTFACFVLWECLLVFVVYGQAPWLVQC